MTIILKKIENNFAVRQSNRILSDRRLTVKLKYVIHVEFNEQGDFHLAEMQKSAMILAIGYWPNGRESGWA